MRPARLEGQLTFDDLVRAEPVTVEGSHAITQLCDLRPGDFIRCDRRNGVIFEGWCVAYDAFNNFWEVEWQWLEHKPGDREFAAPWDDPQDTLRFRILDVDDSETVTYIRHDSQWRFHPNPQELRAWIADAVAKTTPYGSLSVYHQAGRLIFDDEQASTLPEAYLAALQSRWPDPVPFFQDKQWNRTQLSRRIKTMIAACAEMAPLERIDYLQTLRWKIWQFDFFSSIKAPYTRWAIERPELTAENLVEILSTVGWMNIPREEKSDEN